MEKIYDKLKELEFKHDIQILYAVEAGSRAWKLDSIDSDYDIRFIFKHNDSKKYVSLKGVKDHYDGFSEDRIYDWQGMTRPRGIFFKVTWFMISSFLFY